MKKLAILRIVFDAALALCAMFGWWYAALPLGIIAVWLFPYYAELVMAGLFYDALFGLSAAVGFWGYAGTIVSVITTTAVYLVKRSIRRA